VHHTKELREKWWGLRVQSAWGDGKKNEGENKGLEKEGNSRREGPRKNIQRFTVGHEHEVSEMPSRRGQDGAVQGGGRWGFARDA